MLSILDQLKNVAEVLEDKKEKDDPYIQHLSQTLTWGHIT